MLLNENQEQNYKHVEAGCMQQEYPTHRWGQLEKPASRSEGK